MISTILTSHVANMSLNGERRAFTNIYAAVCCLATGLTVAGLSHVYTGKLHNEGLGVAKLVCSVV